MTDIRVTPADVVNSGSCVRGARQWFTLHGMADQFRTFIREGVPLADIQALNCPIANRACEEAINRIERNGQ